MVGSRAEGLEHGSGLVHVVDGAAHGGDEFGVGQMRHLVNDNGVLLGLGLTRRGGIGLLDIVFRGGSGSECGKTLHDEGENGECFRVRIHCRTFCL